MVRRRSSEIAVEIEEHGQPRREGLDGLLRRLAETSYAPARVVSLYLDTRWSDEHQRDRVWVTVRDRVRELKDAYPEDPQVCADLDAAQAFTWERVSQNRDVGYHGVALFRSRAAGLDLSLRVRARLPTLVSVATVPLVRPLVIAAQQHPRAIVAIAGSTTVRVYEVALGGLSDPVELVGDVPKNHERGGWRQLRIQHHRDERIDKLHRDTAATIARMYDEAPCRVVLGGLAEEVANLRRMLPDRVLERALTVGELDQHDPEHELLRSVERALLAAETEEERVLVEQIKTLAFSGGRGALGLDAVLDALNQGRPMRVLVSHRLGGRLHLCRRCHALTRDGVPGCTVCGGATDSLDSVEAIARAAIPLQARVDVVDPAMLGGQDVLAALRF